MRKVMALVLCAVMVLSVLSLAVSARTLTDGEKSIFTELRSTATAADGGFKLPEETIKQGENYLAGTSTPLTDEQVKKILDFIADAKKAVTESGTGVASKWTKETKDRIFADVKDAAEVLNLSARKDNDAAIEIFSPTDGAVIVKQDHLVKVTGLNVQAFVIAGVCGLVALCACTFVSKKVELF